MRSCVSVAEVGLSFWRKKRVSRLQMHERVVNIALKRVREAVENRQGGTLRCGSAGGSHLD